MQDSSYSSRPSPRLSPALSDILEAARQIAFDYGDSSIDAPHIALALLNQRQRHPSLDALLTIANVKETEARLYFEAGRETRPGALNRELPWSTRLYFAFDCAADEAWRDNSNFTQPEHLFLGLMHPHQQSAFDDLVREMGLDFRVLRGQLRQIRKAEHPYPPDHPLSLQGASICGVIKRSHELARLSGCGLVGSGHLLLALLEAEDSPLVGLLVTQGVDVPEIVAQTRSSLSSDGQTWAPTPRFNATARRALERAKKVAFEDIWEDGKQLIEAPHLLWGLLPSGATLAEKLEFDGLKDDVAGEVLARFDPQKIRSILSPHSPGNLTNSRVKTLAPWFLTGLFWWPAIFAAYALLPLLNDTALIFGLGISALLIIFSLTLAFNGKRLWKDRLGSIISGWLACPFILFAGYLLLSMLGVI